MTRKNAGGSRNGDTARNAAVIWTATATAAMAGLNIVTYLLVTWNHRGVSPCDFRDRAVASPQADGDGGPAGDGYGVVRQMAGSKAARAGR